MADQQAGTGARALPEAISTGLDEPREDRPNSAGPPPDIVALGVLIRAITAELDEVDIRWATALNHFADRLGRSRLDAPAKAEEIEREAVRNIGIIASYYRDLLPEESDWRKLFADLCEGLGEDQRNLTMLEVMAAPDKPREDVPETTEDELLVPEEERAAIVAYTGLWQLRETRPRYETDVLRAARLELRRRLDASEEADNKDRDRVEGEDWEPVGKDEETKLLHEIHTAIRDRIPQLDPMTIWGGPLRGIAQSLGASLGRHAVTEIGDREAELGLSEEEIDRLTGWIAFWIQQEFEIIDGADEVLKALTEANRIAEKIRAIRGEVALKDSDRRAAVAAAKKELPKIGDDDPQGKKIAKAVIDAWGGGSEAPISDE